MKRYNKKIGLLGEEKVADYLIENNYNVIERNFRTLLGEIDIIAEDKNTNEIVFIEVKTRANYNYGMPAEAVNNIKKLHILKTANYYLYKNNINNKNIRFDVIEVYLLRKIYKIHHLKQAI